MLSIERQREVCRRFGATYVAVAPEEKLGIALATLDGRQPLNALRHPRQEGTCGWYIWAGDQFPVADDAFNPLHVAHLDEHCPGLVEYLGLEPGFRVLLAPNHADVWYDGTLLDV